MQPISRSACSEVVIVPPDLVEFVEKPHFQGILLKVKSEACVNYISKIADDNNHSLVIDAPNSESGLLARKVT